MRPNDLKALYRRGKAYTQIGKLEVAEKDLKEAQRLDSRGIFLRFPYIEYVTL